MGTFLSQEQRKRLEEAAKRWDDFIAQAQAGAEKFRVIVIGQQNNGKSTLCNALLENWDNTLFRVSDKRETEVIQEKYNQRSGITYIDTPGFGTFWEEDEARARKQWNYANLLIYVHSIRSGELDKDECKMLREIKSTIPDIRERLFVACSKCREEDDEHGQDVLKKVKKQIHDIIGADLAIALIDSLFYQDGKKNDDIALIEFSGMKPLLDWIESHRHIQPAFIRMLEPERNRYLKIVEEAQKQLSNSLTLINKKNAGYDFNLRGKWQESRPLYENAWHNCARYQK